MRVLQAALVLCVAAASLGCDRGIEDFDPDEKPALPVGSPMCTSFSRLQEFNFAKMPIERVREILENGISHLEFCIELYRIQIQGGRYFLHEHPETATS